MNRVHNDINPLQKELDRSIISFPENLRQISVARCTHYTWYQGSQWTWSPYIVPYQIILFPYCNDIFTNSPSRSHLCRGIPYHRSGHRSPYGRANIYDTHTDSGILDRCGSSPWIRGTWTQQILLFHGCCM